MIERQLDIATPDGVCSTFVVHPERDGPHPAVLFLMDAPAIREELRDMARRLASVGYYVMLPNLYYRSETRELWPFPMDPEAPERKRMFELMHSLTIPLVMSDVGAMLAFARTDTAADERRVGVVGYCMSGPFAISAAGAFPKQVKAAASIYGVRLMTDTADSPHLAARKAEAELYIACAESDHWFPVELVAPLAADLATNGVDAEVELYPGVEHGFAFPLRPIYDKPSAERHWSRLFSLFGRRLGV